MTPSTCRCWPWTALRQDFIPWPETALTQLVTSLGADASLLGTDDDVLMEGNPAAPGQSDGC